MNIDTWFADIGGEWVTRPVDWIETPSGTLVPPQAWQVAREHREPPRPYPLPAEAALETDTYVSIGFRDARSSLEDWAFFPREFTKEDALRLWIRKAKLNLKEGDSWDE